MSQSFNTGPPLAYFLTWTTYGTWLPGDDRGWNRRGEIPHLEPNPLFVEVNRSRMAETSFLLTPSDRVLVAGVIKKHCEIRNWSALAINARSNHVHIVVNAANYQPDKVRDQFKAWCTRRLKLKYLERKRFWTEGGSCRWLNKEDDFLTAINYVRDFQDRDESGPKAN